MMRDCRHRHRLLGPYNRELDRGTRRGVPLRRKRTMNRFTIAGASALLLVACTKEQANSTAPADTAAVAPAAHTDAKAVLELGKDI